MFDAVHLFARALSDLDGSKEVQISTLYCEGDKTWQHGNSLINYMKWVGHFYIFVLFSYVNKVQIIKCLFQWWNLLSRLYLKEIRWLSHWSMILDPLQLVDLRKLVLILIYRIFLYNICNFILFFLSWNLEMIICWQIT